MASYKIGFVGAGKMASAIIKGLIKTGFAKPEELIATQAEKDLLEEKSKIFSSAYVDGIIIENTVRTESIIAIILFMVNSLENKIINFCFSSEQKAICTFCF